MSKFLIVNSGSASKKYSFYDDEKEVFHAYLEKEGGEFAANISIKGIEGKINISAQEYGNPHKHMFDLFVSNKLIETLDDIEAVGVRIVAPGSYFVNHYKINAEYISKLKEVALDAPLHITPVLEEISDIKKILPNVRMYGISDTCFHKTLEDDAKYYAIDKSDSDKYDIYKFGYHGISIASVLAKIQKEKGELPSRIIVCHLGGGASVTAVKDGKSIDTSMGYSPLEGLIMANRSGDIDAGALIHLAKKKKMDLEKLEDYLYHKCGLLGLSEASNDIRELLKLEKSGDKNAKLALDSYVRRIKKYIGSYAALLNGLDLLIFTGTVSERSSTMRERICSEMDYLGIKIDREVNNKSIDKDGDIEEPNSNVKVAVRKTDEMGEIVREMTWLK